MIMGLRKNQDDNGPLKPIDSITKGLKILNISNINNWNPLLIIKLQSELTLKTDKL